MALSLLDQCAHYCMLKAGGNTASERELFTMDKIMGPTLLKTTFSIWQAYHLKVSMKALITKLCPLKCTVRGLKMI